MQDFMVRGTVTAQDAGSVRLAFSMPSDAETFFAGLFYTASRQDVGDGSVYAVIYSPDQQVAFVAENGPRYLAHLGLEEKGITGRNAATVVKEVPELEQAALDAYEALQTSNS